MQIYKINSANKEQLFLDLGSDSSGAKIMANKANINMLYIKNIHVGAANILKQDALSIGADLAVPHGVIIAKEKYVNVILIGTNKHFKILSKKELAQPFGLKELAKQLPNFINLKKFNTQVMGVINANDDSFYDSSRFKDINAFNTINKMINDGASIIDIGGVSSKPGSQAITPQEELDRVKPIIDHIAKEKLYNNATFSIDSYEPLVIEYALQNGFKIVNDITGLTNDKVAQLVAFYDASIVIMHMQGSPDTMQDNPKYDDIILDIDSFFKERITKAQKFGIKNIILDVGIGFGKTLEHNLMLLKNLDHFRHFGYEILLGASRKSMINNIIPTPIEQRLPGTIAIHLKGIEQGASIIRVHDVKEHVQAIKVQEAIQEI
ncbi:MAG: dihydropteroate synthase [Campylobacterales bacterium]|nr:dihydropteroate synthase [Campylobacterales bacterium]